VWLQFNRRQKKGNAAYNLEHATQLVEKAAQEGARLILLPELMPTGESLSMWDTAEAMV
jgi:N-carbamoylputrescine amidase